MLVFKYFRQLNKINLDMCKAVNMKGCMCDLSGLEAVA